MTEKDVVYRLKRYRELKAEIKSIELDIKEIKYDISLPAINYSEKTSQTYKFNSEVENQAVRIADRIKELEKEKTLKIIEVERIDNALSVLDEKEYKVIYLKHIKGYRWDNVTYNVDRSYNWCKDLENKALKKILKYF